MNRSELARVAKAMVAKNKGILAADESTGTIKKRFDGIKLESTEEHRRQYRELLFTAAGAAEWISGVILYDETIRQKTKDGTPFPEYLTKRGMLPGIKVDTGAKPFAGFAGETITEGLDGLRERLGEYRNLGARLRSGVRSSTSATAFPRRTRFRPTPMLWRATPPFARRRTSCRSSSRKCSWTAPTLSSAASR